MTKKSQKTIEKEIEEIIRQIISIGYNEGTPPDENWYEKEMDMRTNQLKSLISDIIREIVGENLPFKVLKGKEGEELEDAKDWNKKAFYFNQAKQEIREKARKLGIKI